MSEVSTTTPPSTGAGIDQTTWGKRLKDLLLGTTAVGFIIRGTMIPLLLYAAIFIFAFWRAWVDPDGSAAYFDYLRGLIEMIVSISAILIIIAIGILIVQIARFVNLLRSEIKPITEDTKQAIKSVRITAQFVQKNAVNPVIKANSFIAGLLAFILELARISKILQRRDEETVDEGTSSEQEA